MQRAIVIMGPTASGKSALAMELCAANGGEIVVCDALMVYRGFDIGTNKPSADERARVPHHMLDVLGYDDAMDAQRYGEQAFAIVEAIAQRGKTPVIVVGTYLYYRALVYGLGPLPKSDPALRSELLAKGHEWIASEVARVDPESHAEAHGRNLPRLVRALEVFMLTGRTASSLRKEHGFAKPRIDVDAFVLRPDREALIARIDRRVDQMWRAGWCDEVLRLLDAGVPIAARAMQAVGYREIAAFLRDGGDERAVRDQIAVATRQYARRQSSFFQKETNASVLTAFGDTIKSETVRPHST